MCRSDGIERHPTGMAWESEGFLLLVHPIELVPLSSSFMLSSTVHPAYRHTAQDFTQALPPSQVLCLRYSLGLSLHQISCLHEVPLTAMGCWVFFFGVSCCWTRVLYMCVCVWCAHVCACICVCMWCVLVCVCEHVCV